MRLFLIGWWDATAGDDLIAVAKGLKKKGHKIVYWTLHSKAQIPVCQRQFITTIFHDNVDALLGVPAKVLADLQCDPPGKNLLESLFAAESVVLTMMNKHYDWMGVSERKHLYYQMVGYWDGVFKKYRPDAIIFQAPPHTVYDYIIYALAKIKNITTIMLDDTVVSDRLLVMRDFKEGSVALREELKNSLKYSTSLENLSSDLYDYYKCQTNPEADSTPLYMKKNFRDYSIKNILRIKIKMVIASLKDFSFFTKTLYYLQKKFHANIKDEYKSVQSLPDWKKKFVYVPLQYQPECTTSTLGGHFVDQILMIQILSAALPEDWVIYVKEHPTQWLPRGLNFFSSRYQGYYRTISRIAHVRVVPVATDTYDLLRRCQAVATVTGTAGWEGVLRLKPAIVFGYPWYQHCPGVFKVTDIESCRTVFSDICRGKVNSEESVIKYLHAFDRASFHGYVQAYGKGISRVSFQENVAHILHVLLSELQKDQSIL